MISPDAKEASVQQTKPTIMIYSISGQATKYRFVHNGKIYRFDKLKEAKAEAEALGLEPRLYVFAGA
jgi:hypothetical protein